MKILITLNKTDLLGGSVIWAYTVAEELIRRKHDVYLEVWKQGRNHHRFHKLGVKDHVSYSQFSVNDAQYDLIIGNHLSRFKVLLGKDIVNVCHGAIVELEKPDPRANRYISISKEVQDSLKQQGYESKVVLNPVNLNRYKSNNIGNGFLSLCQGDEANAIIKEVCDELNINVTFHSKYKEPVWDLWDEIPKYELVFSLGRGVYEALACDKPVIVMDSRGYTPSYGDGYMGEASVKECLYANCSGRTYKYDINKSMVKEWICEYLQWDRPRGYYRKIAENHFNVVNLVDEILSK